MKIKNDFALIYQDDAVLVLNKRSGLLTAADRYDQDALRLDVLAKKEFGELFAVHRIDKDTSGLIIYARTAEAHRALSIAFEKREVYKTYHALVYGRPMWKSTTCNAPLLPDGDIRHRTVINMRDGKSSKTDFRVLGSCNLYSWVEACPVTGRTHQIRVHAAHLGFQIVCDPLYGGNQKVVRLSDIKRSWRGDVYEERPLLERLALHAYNMQLDHPISGEKMSFTAPYARDMEAVRKQLLKLYRIDPLACETEKSV